MQSNLFGPMANKAHESSPLKLAIQPHSSHGARSRARQRTTGWSAPASPLDDYRDDFSGPFRGHVPTSRRKTSRLRSKQDTGRSRRPPWSPPPRRQTRSESPPIYRRQKRAISWRPNYARGRSASPTRASRRANHAALTSMRRHHLKNRARQLTQQKRFNKALAPYWKNLSQPKLTFADPKEYKLPDLADINDALESKNRSCVLPHEMLDAAMKGELTTVRQAIELDGVSPDYKDRDFWGDTALHRAAENGHLHVVKYLVLRASCNTRAKSAANGETAQRAAEKTGQWHIVAFLKGFEQWQCTAEESSTFLTRREALKVSSGQFSDARLSPKSLHLKSSIIPNLERVAFATRNVNP